MDKKSKSKRKNITSRDKKPRPSVKSTIMKSPPSEQIGFGKFEFKSKIIYIGHYKILKTGQRVREGFGKVIHQSTQDNIGEEYYEGEWKDDKMNGYGIYHYANGDIYEGDWLNNMQHGYGKYIFNDGYHYEGEWQNHKMHGTGKYLDVNNIGFGGEFRDGCYFSKDQLKLKEEKRIMKKIAKIKEIPFQFFKTWEETADNVDKKTVDDMLSPFFAKDMTMGKFFKNITFPCYEDYKPEYWNDTIRWAFGMKKKNLGEELEKKNLLKNKKKKGASSVDKKITNKENNNISILKPTTEEEGEGESKPKIEISVPKNGNDLIFLNKDCLEVPQLQEEMASGQVIEIRSTSTTDDRVVCIAIGFKRDINKWLIIFFSDNKAPPKEVKKTKAKSKAKSKGKKSTKK